MKKLLLVTAIAILGFATVNAQDIDFGVNFGIVYKLDNGLNFNARYNWGLTNITVEHDITKNNSVFQLSVGYFF
ncbi:hypothetical protein [Thalassobellus citreus]|uniref:hypothetical protein n=1 Tax=Thalassobellus citreus TaxID=3367752 RepID=UPI0037BB3A56